jgi:archaemetzincin
MIVGILPVGNVETENLAPIEDKLAKSFPKTTAQIVDERLPLSENSYDKKRRQYRSNQMLANLQGYAAKSGLSRILGVLDVDIFVPELNFVFGEAAFPGKAALISLWRLKPEFYGEPANAEVLEERALKEAVHEVGHTLGLKHCQHSSCVMHFSNAISDTDIKNSVFCDECRLLAAIAIDCLK